MQARPQVVVAVINSNDDLVQALRNVLEEAGYAVVTGHIRDIKAGKLDFPAFLQSHNPDVVVYDVAVPYEDNWSFLQTLRQVPTIAERNFVITTVNKRQLELRVGRTAAVEIVGGHAQDFEETLEAIRETLKARK